MNSINNAYTDFINSLNILNIISGYINVNKKGSQYVCICPFHNDTKPSLSVSIEKKIWKCFSCNVGGNALTFVMKYKKLNFNDAIAEISTKFNISAPKSLYFGKNLINKKQYSENQNKIINIYKIANNFFKYNLFVLNNKNFKIINYFKDRKIKKETAMHFELGYSDSGKNFVNYLKSKNIDLDEAVNCGLLIIKNDNYKNYFNNRIIFPIYDKYKNIIGFSGRSINNMENIKYLNSKTNDLFSLNNACYNINCLYDANINSKCLIVEGLFDVLSFYQSGLKTCVSFFGLNINKDYLRFIINNFNHIVLALDNDEAGFLALFKYLEILVKNKINIEVIKYDDNIKDANEYLIKNNEKKLLFLSENSIYDYGTFIINKILQCEKEKNEYIKKLLYIVNLEKDFIYKSNLIKKINETFNIKLVNIDKNNLVSQSINNNKKYKNDWLMLLWLKHNPNLFFKLISWFLPNDFYVKKILVEIYNEYLNNDKKINEVIVEIFEKNKGEKWNQFECDEDNIRIIKLNNFIKDCKYKCKKSDKEIQKKKIINKITFNKEIIYNCNQIMKKLS